MKTPEETENNQFRPPIGKECSVIMTDKNNCCDVYPEGAIIKGYYREDNLFQVSGSYDVIPRSYPFQLVPELLLNIMTFKKCPTCTRSFPTDFTFINVSKSPLFMQTNFVCPRCYDRYTKTDR